MTTQGDQEAACATCSKTASEISLHKCSGCKTIQYCSKDCQKADWPTHKKACKSATSKKKQGKQSPNVRIPGIIEIGPVTTVGAVLAAKPGDPPPEYKERMYSPTVKQLHKRCMEIMGTDKGDEGGIGSASGVDKQ